MSNLKQLLFFFLIDKQELFCNFVLFIVHDQAEKHNWTMLLLTGS